MFCEGLRRSRVLRAANCLALFREYLTNVEVCVVIEFVCDTCSATKQPEEVWIAGLAAEAVGAVSARREVEIQSAWTREAAVNRLAVHFCSIECKNKYIAQLFGTEPVEEVVVERTAPAEVVVEEIPQKVVTKKRNNRRIV
jgi:hypothetical protein